MQKNGQERQYWLDTMLRIAAPVLQALSERQLKQLMPVEAVPGQDRTIYTHLEALARLLNGMAPWLERESNDSQEEARRRQYCALAREAIRAGTDPDSPDYMNFTEGGQPIVDAAFLAHAVLRAPVELWEKQDDQTKRNLIIALKQTRRQKPAFNNWLLFAGIIEACLYKVGEQEWDPMRIDFAFKQLDQWYMGDGVYQDGPRFHFDYYNSFVIHPMIVDLVETVGAVYQDWHDRQDSYLQRAQRYAAILERHISPEGTYPPIGRSLAYRFGVFQSLAQSVLRHELPAELSPAQVRTALTAVIEKTVKVPGMFDANGWLQIGLTGHQPEIGEPYISTGSLYLCSTVFLPLGLPKEDEFWTSPAEPWTAKKAWEGSTFPLDAAKE
ncbi:DUF2264 domain-containing protein [Gracilibacillus alcaliphilus]|uniref:DUF2264 domain-containing protein n=1 Tax=Gracilibacillus alcaliphilus TaxID=1401441 RepID=UPI0019565D0B|nr:DUF2264 domain-containing protein [Gracilibacillus alcaliphilus]MBM7675457.1 hypothetical protein [Gracilibacillus alcaliphilus]